MKIIFRIMVLAGAFGLFLGCGETRLTEEQIQNEVVLFLESRDYPSAEQLDIRLQWREQEEIWHAEVTPVPEFRSDLDDWDWPVEILVSPSGVVVGVN
jgi:hypothetical protein